MDWSQPVTELPGIGPERAAQLRRLGIQRAGDFLLHRPRRYEDRRQVSPIHSLELGQTTAARGPIVAAGLNRFARGRKSVFEIILDDGSGRLHCRWWNLPFMRNYFSVGQEVYVFGKIVSLRPRAMDHPETEIVEPGEESIHLRRIAPIYPLTEGISQRWLRQRIWQALQSAAGKLSETQPILAGRGFLAYADAVRKLHFPDELDEIEAARQRLALDEYIDFQIQLQTRRRRLQTDGQTVPCPGDRRWIRPFLKSLGFQLNPAQQRVLREIRDDLARPIPMRRLLQGDVGAGKTVVSACAALLALESGRNAVLMAPTELLAEQHFAVFRKWFELLGISVERRTGSLKTDLAAETPLRRTGADLSPRMVIGTHALIEDAFQIPNLGLVIIDEQHKFGVAQREALVRKGRFPHLLMMTATPIPRTLGLTLYGDLDCSTIDHLPHDRKPIRTFVRTAEKLPQIWAFVKKQLAAGRQAYIVCARVEIAEKAELKAVREEYLRLREILSPFQVGLVHGGAPREERERVMAAFRDNRVQALAATPVIEVGVDVPNATVMVVENAERFGLAQLHQLRGRIGRGAHESFCILISAAQSAEAEQRLSILAEEHDGFRIADLDLRLRGPGDFLGRDQSGLPPLRFGDLQRDEALIRLAREIALNQAPRP